MNDTISPLKDFLQKVDDFLPGLLIAILILAIGILIAWILKKVIIKLSALMDADKYLSRFGLSELFQKGGIKESPTLLISSIVYWFIIFIFSIISLHALKVSSIDHLVERLFLYMPNVFIAIILIVLGYIISNFASRAVLISSVNAGFTFAGTLSKFVKAVIIIFTLTMAMEQLGIGRETIMIVFAIIFGGIVFALSLSFGLAGVNIAKKYLEKKLKHEEEPKNDLKHL